MSKREEKCVVKRNLIPLPVDSNCYMKIQTRHLEECITDN